MHKLSFVDHRRSLLQNRYIYAVVSRRAKGLSIGINLNPDKSCNFDCPYCQVDRTAPGGDRNVDVSILTRELHHLFSLIHEGKLWSIEPFNTASPEMQIVRDISFSGDGEPCSAKEFGSVVQVVAKLREEFSLSHVRYQLLSNATLFHKLRVQKALKDFWNSDGMIWAKLDAGTESWFHKVDGTRIPFQRILDNILWAGKQAPITLQSMFHRFGTQEPSMEEIDAWGERILTLIEQGAQIAKVQIYSTARQPSDPSVGPLSKEKLEVIGVSLKEKLKGHPLFSQVRVY